MGQTVFFFVYFRSFQANINTTFTANQCEKWPFHPVYGAGIRTHNLSIMSHLRWPLDQGSAQKI